MSKFDSNFKTFKNEIRKASNLNTDGLILSYDEAIEEVRNELQDRLMQELSVEKELEKITEKKEAQVKDKEYLREKKERYKGLIEDVVNMRNIKARDYENNRDGLIDMIVSELVGYDILEDAFNDPRVSDVYVISWNKIFVERNGKNELYPKKFRNAKHFQDVLSRFLREAGKEINIGDAKIVDFELYGDRGCATSPAVTPIGYSLTMRKHLEADITRDDLIKQDVMDEELSELLGLLIEGETNVICAGITGSGKTTTIRALLDYYVTRLNKRMIVFEDTQELFPKNEHTLQFVSVKADDDRVAVPLKELIFTGLRLKPKYNVVGEVRGPEAEAAVESMETGHSTILSMHGGTAWNVVNRLVTKYLMSMPSLGTDVVERIIGSGVDYVFVQDDIPNIGRKITSLTEVSYDFRNKRVALKIIGQYNRRTKSWEWENKLGKEKVDKMFRRGASLEMLDKWEEK